MTDDRFMAQPRAILEGCPFNMERAIADDLREADAENQRLRRELSWALEMLERHAGSKDVLDQVRHKRAALSKKSQS